MDKLIGRQEEKKILDNALASSEAELIALYGRRRVGKTFLIRSLYNGRIIFEMTGIHEAKLTEQLENFSLSLQKAMGSSIPPAVPDNWIKAFDFLQQHLSTKLSGQKSVIFLDEFPWIHTPKSSFLQAFEHFWNTWASRQNNLVVVIRSEEHTS